MTPGKEGPPTLRECREILKECLRTMDAEYGKSWISKTMGLIEPTWAQKIARKMVGSLTDEALERDEKRTAALEALLEYRKKIRVRDMSHAELLETLSRVNGEWEDLEHQEINSQHEEEEHYQKREKLGDEKRQAQIKYSKAEAEARAATEKADEAMETLDALTPAPKERQAVKPNPLAHNHVDGKTCPQCKGKS